MTDGISRRRYAKRRGCSEAAIRRRISDGTLDAALLADGTIDADKADALLAASTMAGPHASRTLAAARRRKLAASTALLRDDVEAIEAAHIPAGDVDEAVRTLCREFGRRLFRIAGDAAPLVAGRPAGVAHDALQDVTYRALDDLAGTDVVAADDAAAPAPSRGRSLARMSSAELATLRADLQARGIELRHAVQRGELVPAETCMDDLMRRVGNARARLLAMPSKLAPAFESLDEAGAAAAIDEAIGEALAELAGPEITLAEMREAADAA